MSSPRHMEPPPLGEGQMTRRGTTGSIGGDRMKCIIRGTTLLVTKPQASRGAASGKCEAGEFLQYRDKPIPQEACDACPNRCFIAICVRFRLWCQCPGAASEPPGRRLGKALAQECR